MSSGAKDREKSESDSLSSPPRRLFSSLRRAWLTKFNRLLPPTPSPVPPGTKLKIREAEVESRILSLSFGRTKKGTGGTACFLPSCPAVILNLALPPPAATSALATEAASAADKEEIHRLLKLVRSGSDELRVSASYSLWQLARNVPNSIEIAALGGIAAVIHLAKQERASAVEKENIAGILRQLARHQGNRLAICDAGGPSVLLSFLQNMGDGARDKGAVLRRNALNALVDLAKVPRQYRVTVLQGQRGLSLLLSLLKEGSDYEKERTSRILWILAREKENQCLIGEKKEIFPLLVELLAYGNGRQRENAAGALWYLAFKQERSAAIIAAGAVPYLISLADSGTEGERVNAAGALWRLLSTGRGERKRLVKAAGAVPPLVRLLSPLSLPDPHSESLEARRLHEVGSALSVSCALKSLSLICKGDEKALKEVEEAIKSYGGRGLHWLLDAKMERLNELASHLVQVIVQAQPSRRATTEEIGSCLCLLGGANEKDVHVHVHVDVQQPPAAY